MGKRSVAAWFVVALAGYSLDRPEKVSSRKLPPGHMGSFTRTLYRLAGGSPASSVVMGCGVLVPVAETAVVVAGGGATAVVVARRLRRPASPPMAVFMSILAGCGCA